MEQTFGVQQVIHPQCVDECLDVIGCVVKGQLTLVGLEELPEHDPQRHIGCIEAVVRCHGFFRAVEIHRAVLKDDALIVHRKGNAVVLVPGECNGGYSSLVKAQGEAFDVTGEAWVLVQRLKGCTDLLPAFGVLSRVDDAATNGLVVAGHT